MIADILKDEIPSVPSEGSIEMASRILQEEDITEIVVTEDGRFVYMLRELDLISSSGEKIQEIPFYEKIQMAMCIVLTF